MVFSNIIRFTGNNLTYRILCHCLDFTVKVKTLEWHKNSNNFHIAIQLPVSVHLNQPSKIKLCCTKLKQLGSLGQK